MNKCKHGMVEGTCALCMGLSQEKGSKISSGVVAPDYKSGNSYNKILAELKSATSHKWAKDKAKEHGFSNLVQVCGNSHDLSLADPKDWWVKLHAEAVLIVLVGHYGNLDNPEFWVIPKENFLQIATKCKYFGEGNYRINVQDVEEWRNYEQFN